jgi:hypothetical protein
MNRWKTKSIGRGIPISFAVIGIVWFGFSYFNNKPESKNDESLAGFQKHGLFNVFGRNDSNEIWRRSFAEDLNKCTWQMHAIHNNYKVWLDRLPREMNSLYKKDLGSAIQRVNLLIYQHDSLDKAFSKVTDSFYAVSVARYPDYIGKDTVFKSNWELSAENRKKWFAYERDYLKVFKLYLRKLHIRGDYKIVHGELTLLSEWANNEQKKVESKMTVSSGLADSYRQLAATSFRTATERFSGGRGNVWF